MGQNSALSLSGTESTDKLTQMEYLLCSSWKWLPPYRTPDILSALLEYVCVCVCVHVCMCVCAYTCVCSHHALVHTDVVLLKVTILPVHIMV